MTIFKNEKNIINFIKYGAIFTVLILSISITVLFITQKNSELEKDIKILEKEYLVHNKTMTENLVNKIYTLIELEKEFERKIIEG